MFNLPIDMITHSLDRLLLLALLGGTLFLARRAAVRQAGGMDQLARLATGLLLCLGIWWLWLGLTAFIGIPRALWLCPFDRLLQTMTLAMVGWLALGRAGTGGGQRWRSPMVLAFAVMLPVYLGWAPEWARAMQANPTAAPPMAAARIWDAWQAFLALGLAWIFVRRQAGAWSFGIVGGLLVASVLDVLSPVDAMGADYAPVWGRMGLLAIGIGMAAHALQRNWELGLLQGLPAVFPTRRPSPAAGIQPPLPLAPTAPPGRPDPDLVRIVSGQAAQIGRLADLLTAISGRLERLEQAPPPVVSASDPALLAQLHGYREALGRLPAGLLLTDTRGMLSYANPAAADLLGRAPLPGEPLSDSLRAGEATSTALRLLLAGDKAQTRADHVPPGGSVRLRTDLHTLRDAEGGIGGILAVLSRDPGNLDAAGLALVPELIEALTAPITSFRGYSHLIQQGKNMLQGEGQVDRYLERIDANLSRLKVMLGNLSMILNGDAAAERQSVSEVLDLHDRLDQSLERARQQLQEKGLQGVRVGDGQALLQGDEAVVDLLLDNLLVHAIQRSPMGGDVRLSARVEGGQLVLEVLDRGRNPEATEPAAPVEQAVSLADPDVRTELKAAQIVAGRQGGRVWLKPFEGGLCSCASLPVRETGLSHRPLPTDD